MSKIESRLKRKKRIRKTISGVAAKPRITVYRSNKYFYAQAIDDVNHKTLAAAKTEKNTTIAVAEKLGEAFGEQLQKKKISQAVLDRNGYAYHGQVAAFTNGLRSAKIKI